MKATIAFIIVFLAFLVMGVGVLVWASYRMDVLLYTECWIQVTGPFSTLEKLGPGRDVNLNMKPSCFEKLVITDSTEKCRETCEKDEKCIKKCTKVDGMGTFFVLVQKEKAWYTKARDYIFETVDTLRGKFFDRNTAYRIHCNLEKDRIFPVGKENECKTLRVTVPEGSDICEIVDKGAC